MYPIRPAARTATLLLGVTALGLAGAVFLLPPIPQPEAYHDFADQRSWLGIPHFANTVSNLGFGLTGVLGLAILWVSRQYGVPVFRPAEDRWPYAMFFLAAVGIAIGSSYYHLDPGHHRLFWDRLPMAIAFTALLAAVLQERTPASSGWRWVWLPLLTGLGLLGTLHWYGTELAGTGDLRAYLLVQLIPLVGGPLAVVLLASRYDRSRDFLIATACYVVALVADRLDHPIHTLTGELISGHTVKHVVATAAMVAMIRMLCRRAPMETAALDSHRTRETRSHAEGEHHDRRE